MSQKHPIVVVTGSSGAGTSTVKKAFEAIFLRENISPCVIEGDSFHRFDRAEMKIKMEAAVNEGRDFSHFGAEANEFSLLEDLFKSYSETGSGKKRFYLHSEPEADEHNARLGTDKKPGEFTPWEDIEADTDLMFYEGLHGCVKNADIDMTQWVDLRRMPDYIKYITPQFSETDINFQRVSTVDTSNPFIARDIPTPDESFVVIRFKDPAKFDTDFPYLLSMIHDSFMSRRNTIVVPGGKMGLAMEIILTPIIHRMLEKRGG